MIRRCPRCHSSSDDQYGFCIRCGYEFEKIDETSHICPLCNYPNPEEAEYCVKCGTPLIFKNKDNTTVSPIIIKKTVINEETPSYTSRFLIILGYIFSILGGIVGLIIAIYLATRKDPVMKKHGRIQLAIFLFYIILILILIATGVISMDTLKDYNQLTMNNFTNLTL